MENKTDLPYYWICSECAKAMKAEFPKWPVTASVGECQYCQSKDVGLIPVVDFKWPNGPNAEWD